MTIQRSSPQPSQEVTWVATTTKSPPKEDKHVEAEKGEKPRMKPQSTPAIPAEQRAPFYQCRYCKFASLNEKVVKSHVDEQHLSERTFICPLCELAYCKHEEAMRRHFRKWHPKDPVYLLLEPGYTDINKEPPKESTPIKATQDAAMLGKDAALRKSSSPSDGVRKLDGTAKDAALPPIILKVPNLPFSSPATTTTSPTKTTLASPPKSSADTPVSVTNKSPRQTMTTPVAMDTQGDASQDGSPAETVSRIQEAVAFVNNVMKHPSDGLPDITQLSKTAESQVSDIQQFMEGIIKNF